LAGRLFGLGAHPSLKGKRGIRGRGRGAAGACFRPGGTSGAGQIVLMACPAWGTRKGVSGPSPGGVAPAGKAIAIRSYTAIKNIAVVIRYRPGWTGGRHG